MSQFLQCKAQNDNEDICNWASLPNARKLARTQEESVFPAKNSAKKHHLKTQRDVRLTEFCENVATKAGSIYSQGKAETKLEKHIVHNATL